MYFNKCKYGNKYNPLVFFSSSFHRVPGCLGFAVKGPAVLCQLKNAKDLGPLFLLKYTAKAWISTKLTEGDKMECIPYSIPCLQTISKEEHLSPLHFILAFSCMYLIPKLLGAPSQKNLPLHSLKYNQLKLSFVSPSAPFNTDNIELNLFIFSFSFTVNIDNPKKRLQQQGEEQRYKSSENLPWSWEHGGWASFEGLETT